MSPTLYRICGLAFAAQIAIGALALHSALRLGYIPGFGVFVVYLIGGGLAIALLNGLFMALLALHQGCLVTPVTGPTAAATPAAHLTTS
jgi:hypothetical protein